MAVFRATSTTGAVLDVELEEIIAGLDVPNVTITIATSSRIQAVSDDGIVADFFGRGFTYDSSGFLIGGTLDRVAASANGESFDISEIDRDIVTLGDLVVSDDIAGALAVMFSGDDTIFGTPFDDVLNGFAGNDVLYGDSGDDDLRGEAGNDQLRGDAGSDTLRGGPGDDLFIVEDAGDMVIEAAGEGHDAVRSSVSHVLAANVEDLRLLGSADIDGTGNALGNTIIGNAGANALDGGGGKDRLYGEAGDDVLTGGDGGLIDGGLGDDLFLVNGRTSVRERAGEGTDAVRATVDHTLSDHVEFLRLLGTGDIAGKGNAQDNTIVGNAGRNVLDGRGGSDRLFGEAGDDILITDDGDLIDGGPGDDLFLVDGQAAVRERAGEGADAVRATADQTLSDHVESLRLLGTGDFAGKGNAQDNTIAGNAGANVLDGRGGFDRVFGGKGDDLLIARDGDFLAGQAGDDLYWLDTTAATVREQPGEGRDAVRSTVSHTLSADIEFLRLLRGGDVDGTGNAQANTLAGNGGANTLDGRGGNDILRGGGGNDRLIGGAGDDRLKGDGGDDTFVFGSGFGEDRVSDFATGDLFEVSTALATEFSDLAVTQVGSDALISVAGNTIRVSNVAPADLDAADFTFV